ncbi:MAG: hypothetical protein KJ728_05165 [Alphaproteobacteria bacterium]|jgi:hypothetical protein|uniref:DUF995 domain-containing protein n=2 Tax=Brevundimonas mediterranea TaxID=74329 RepID=A0AB37EAV2_9CAUL|nr:MULTISPECIES: hypothetical protein [Brevundimonas]MBU1270792.1 hypothetical protein [Alphaproteobacteria bacterium]OGN43662.1 MAG: hypothetical protein A2093_04595 [Caulobacterales bacterium GWE1_67_11]OHC91630.1 MAG: hypothetical protein A2792_10495 [Sphingomonadales bacterium RIFCSPHIGHO2_01_FULL_65_20]OYX81669.1 MAG: hypothetical protein B7Y85_00745 [Brevundimonas sp. 32-68-21]EDX78964.1 hypothetical protein BBAL3_121 [Brevundimonas sp. BAL3]
MMRTVLIGCGLALGVVVASTAPARADMAEAFGNTIVSHYPNGQWVKHFFEPDGRYVSQFSDGRQLSARWSREGDKICLTGFRPRQILPRFCSRMVEADIGQSWQARDPLGRTIRNELVAGRR